MGLEEKAFGTWAEGAGKANAILSIVKFIATYTFLEGEIRVEAPGQPLVRTKNPVSYTHLTLPTNREV